MFASQASALVAGATTVVGGTPIDFISTLPASVVDVQHLVLVVWLVVPVKRVDSDLIPYVKVDALCLASVNLCYSHFACSLNSIPVTSIPSTLSPLGSTMQVT